MKRLLGAAAVVVVLVLFLMPKPEVPVTPQKIPDSGTYSADDHVVDLGGQPLAVPIGVFTELMKRDRVLARALKQQGLSVRFHDFAKGKDVNARIKTGELEGAYAGDMPTLSAAVFSNVRVVALAKQNYSSLVVKGAMMGKGLSGRTIAYAPGSTAHYALLQILRNLDLDETRVTLKPMQVSDMIEALERGEVDGFAAWEPTPAIALAKNPHLQVAGRLLNTSYLYFSDAFASRQPEGVRLLVAAQVRAIRWMRQERKDLHQAALWWMEGFTAFAGKRLPLNEREIARLVEEGILSISEEPAIPQAFLAEGGSLQREFQFLAGLGKIPAATDWKKVQNRFDNGPLQEVLREEKRYELGAWDYGAP